jgi:hypothetical protein
MSANDMVVGLKLFGDRALAHQQRGNCALVQHGGGCQRLCRREVAVRSLRRLHPHDVVARINIQDLPGDAT